MPIPIAKKNLGQHFLTDPKITDRIVHHAGILTNDIVLEIGPGPGYLSKSILNANPKRLVAIEKDSDMIPLLTTATIEHSNKIDIIRADAVKIDIQDIICRLHDYRKQHSANNSIQNKTKDSEQNDSLIIVANLPYNIGTHLLLKWLKETQNIKRMVLTLQKEVVLRIISNTNSKNYGYLSIMSQIMCDTKKLFDIKMGSYSPPPKVMSSVVMLTPKDLSIKPSIETLLNVEKICKIIFSQKRKMLKAVTKNNKMLEEAILVSDIKLTDRPDKISPNQILQISKLYKA